MLGNDQTVAFCGAAGGQFQLNVMMPVMADAILESVRLLARTTAVFTTGCLAGMEADAERCRAEVERSIALATGLNPCIGSEPRRPWPRKPSRRARRSAACPAEEALSESQLDEVSILGGGRDERKDGGGRMEESLPPPAQHRLRRSAFRPHPFLSLRHFIPAARRFSDASCPSMEHGLARRRSASDRPAGAAICRTPKRPPAN